MSTSISPSAQRVAGRVVIVTGAARGQGAAEANLLASAGAVVVATDVIEPDPGGLADEVAFTSLDVRQPDSWVEVVDRVVAEHGHIDALVNNAGISSRARFDTITLDEWDKVLDVNLTGPFLGMRAVMDHMPPGGSIVNVCSLAGLTGHYAAGYSTSKWALRGLSRVASLELGERGIRVNAIFPGHVATPMIANAPPSMVALSESQIPLGRIGTTDDIAPLVLFLVSNESSWISGAEISIDGGQWAHGGAKITSDELRSLAAGAT